MKKRVLLLLLLTLILLPTESTRANAGPPPAEIWFSFQDEGGTPLEPSGIQIIGCAEKHCTGEILLLSYGRCDQPGCLPDEPSMQGGQYRLECAGGLCRATTSKDDPARFFRLVINVDGKISTSEPEQLLISLAGDPNQTFDELYSFISKAYQVIVSAEGLTLSSDPDFLKPKSPSSGTSFPLALLLTLVCELLVAWIYLWFVLRWRGAQLTTLLVLVCLANLVTLPLVWILFPSFVPFSNYETRAFGILLGIAALYFSFVLYLFFVRLEGRHRWKFLAANLLVLLLVFPAGSFFILLSIGYSHQYELLTSGLPGTWLLLISEVFAWLYEAVFLYFLSSKKLVWKHALLLSLLMNLTSYLAGWLSLVI